MNNQFLTYRKFNDLALAEVLAATLTDNNIEFEFEDNSAVLYNPAIIADEMFSKEYCVKVRKDDFERIDALLTDVAERSIDEVDPDHYLFAFTDDELMEVLINYDEWNAFDVSLARKLLLDRGCTIDDKEMANIRQAKIKELKKPEDLQTTWVTLGYIFTLLGGVLGMFIGWHLSRYQRTLPNGEQVYAYQESDRIHGQRIFILGIVVFVITLGYKIYVETN